MSRTKFFDLNHQAMPESRRLTPEGTSLTARQLVARTAISAIADARPPFSQLYVASSPYCRELFGFYPAVVSMGRFVLETHVARAAKPGCNDEQCGAILYDRGYISVSGMHERPEMQEQDMAYEWVQTTLKRIHERTGVHNPLVGKQAAEYLGEMHENGHHFIEQHNQIEVDYALEGNAFLAEIPAERMPYRNNMRR